MGPLIELLRVLLKQRCEDFGVAQKLVASSDDIEAIAADDAAEVAGLVGLAARRIPCRRARVKHGKLALTAGRNRIELVALGGDQERAEGTG